jgi:hypothetical protein
MSVATSQFNNYENIDINYIPNNSLITPIKKQKTIYKNIPYKEYDRKGRLRAYYWNYKDQFTLNIDFDKTYYVDEDAIVYTLNGEAPTKDTIGKIGQYCYNTADILCWQCIGIIDEQYLWKQKDSFIIPSYGTKKIFINPDFTNSVLEVNILNFRREVIDTILLTSLENIDYCIDEELANLLIPGLYFITLTLKDENELLVDDSVFCSDTLFVQNKFIQQLAEYNIMIN